VTVSSEVLHYQIVFSIAILGSSTMPDSEFTFANFSDWLGNYETAGWLDILWCQLSFGSSGHLPVNNIAQKQPQGDMGRKEVVTKHLVYIGTSEPLDMHSQVPDPGTSAVTAASLIWTSMYCTDIANRLRNNKIWLGIPELKDAMRIDVLWKAESWKCFGSLIKVSFYFLVPLLSNCRWLLARATLHC
jgi:hypothetical protein